MSILMDHYLLSRVPPIVDLQKTDTLTVQTRIEEAIERMKLTTSDAYDSISVFSVYWELDETGGKDDSSLFIHTLSKLRNVQTCQRSLSDKDYSLRVGFDIINRAELQSGDRKLFILHYAGHAIAGSTLDSLMIIPSIGQKLGDGPQINMSAIKDELKEASERYLGLDILIVMDSCHAAIAGRGARQAKGARVELMAATARMGISNSRVDGHTFTQHWCQAFTKLLDDGNPFTCDDIIKVMSPHPELEQFPSSFVLREGWDLPIIFRPYSSPIQSSLPAVTSQMVITAFHVEENPNSASMEVLVDYLKNAPIPITVLAALPVSSTLLLLVIPVFLEELLILPRVTLMLA